jgi:hypothetical protein
MSMYSRPRMTSTHSSTAACIPSSIRCCRTCSASCHPSHQRPRSTSSTHGPPSTPRSHDTRSPTPSGSYLTGLVHHIALRTVFRRTIGARAGRFGAGGFSLPRLTGAAQISQIWRARVRRRSGSSSRRFGWQARARVPGPGNPRPAVTASAGQCEWRPWAAPSGDPGTPRPPWAANPGVFPQPTSAIEKLATDFRK